jgi:flagellar M-ring protein FliF
MSYLTSVLGTGNADVQVNANLDFNQVNSSSNNIITGKNGQPITTCTSTQNTSTKYTGTGTPPGSSINTTGNSGGNYTQTQSQKTCEAGSESTTTKQAPGSVTQQDVAVLINQKALPKGTSIASLRQGVAAAAGIVASRGDILSFSQAPFAAAPAAPAAPKTSKLSSYEKPGLAAVLLIVILVLMLLASRRARKRRIADPLPDPLALEQYFPMAPDPHTEEIPAVGAPDRTRSIATLQSIVDNQTEDVARVITGWLVERGR